MANKVQLKASGEQDFTNDDPFAELTRIMGFDPRVQPTPHPDDDFEIDLEKELMGVFGTGETPAEAASSEGYPQKVVGDVPAADEIDEAFASSLERELSDDFDMLDAATEAAETPLTSFSAGEAFDAAGTMASVDMDFAISHADETEWKTSPGMAENFQEDLADESGLELHHGVAEADENPVSQDYRSTIFETSSLDLLEERQPHQETQKPTRSYGAIFDIRTVRSTTSRHEEAAPQPVAEEKPAPRAKAVDPFDILAALGTERGYPQRPNPFARKKEPQAAPVAPQSEQVGDLEIPVQAESGLLPDGPAEEEQPSAAMTAEEELPSATIPAEEEEYGSFEPLGEEFEAPAASPAMQPVYEDQLVPFEVISAVKAQEEAFLKEDQFLEEDDFQAVPEPDVSEFGYDLPSFEMADQQDAVVSRVAEASPEIETMEVAEPAVAIADDLDIPVPDYQTEIRAAPVYDELDQEFEQAFQKLSVHSDAIRDAATVRTETPESFNTATEIEQLFAEELVAMGDAASVAAHEARSEAAGSVTAAAYGGPGYVHAADLDFDHEDFLPDEYAASTAAGGGFAVEQEGALKPAPRRARLAKNQGMLVAGVVAGVVVLGGIGAFALSHSGGDESSQPVILKADAHPVKVKPKNPGGMNVPNQDNKVYERVEDGVQEVAPKQKKLVSAEEQPIDVSTHTTNTATALPGVFEDDQIGTSDDAPNARTGKDGASPAEAKTTSPTPSTKVGVADVINAAAAEPAPQPKGEDRLAPTNDASAGSANSDILVVTPRRVKTMIVRADGTMVPREDADVTPVEKTPKSVADAVIEAPAAALPAAAPVPTEDPQMKLASAQPDGAAPAARSKTDGDAMATMASAKVEPDAAKPAKASDAWTEKAADRKPHDQINTPSRVAVAPSRPSDQPLDIVGAKPQRVASAEAAPAPAPVAAASGDWSVQIASQPTAEGAQTSYQNLAHRYGSVLGGHAVNIVRADIAGKGTYYRVRMAANSKDDAIALCTKYKAAGGSCFVSK